MTNNPVSLMRLGSFVPIINDVGQIYTNIFDHRSILDKEIKALITTFEEKTDQLIAFERGKETLSILRNVLDETGKNLALLENTKETVDDMNKKCKDMLVKEYEWIAERAKERELKEPIEEKEMASITLAADEEKALVEKEAQEKRQALIKKYSNVYNTIYMVDL